MAWISTALKFERAESPREQTLHAAFVAGIVDRANPFAIRCKQNAANRGFELVIVQQHGFTRHRAMIPTNTWPHTNATAAIVPPTPRASEATTPARLSASPNPMPEMHPDRPARAWRYNSLSTDRYREARTSGRSS